MEEYGLEKARDILGEVVDRAALAGEVFTITRHGKPKAVVLGYDDYQDMRAKLGLDENGAKQDGEQQ